MGEGSGMGVMRRVMTRTEPRLAWESPPSQPFPHRGGRAQNGRPSHSIPVRAAINPNKFNTLEIKSARQSEAFNPPVNSSHLVAVERAHGQRPVRRRGVIERGWGRGGYPIASGAFRRCGNPPAIGLGEGKHG